LTPKGDDTETECHAVRAGDFSRDDTISTAIVMIIGLV
jgi:hypothetical protein